MPLAYLVRFRGMARRDVVEANARASRLVVSIQFGPAHESGPMNEHPHPLNLLETLPNHVWSELLQLTRIFVGEQRQGLPVLALFVTKIMFTRHRGRTHLCTPPSTATDRNPSLTYAVNHSLWPYGRKGSQTIHVTPENSQRGIELGGTTIISRTTNSALDSNGQPQAIAAQGVEVRNRRKHPRLFRGSR